MLTPAVRRAAAEHAAKLTTAPVPSQVQVELLDAYETGYCRGYQARATQRASFALGGQRELLLALAPYLPYGVDVYHPATGRYGRLRGLPACYEGQGEPLADVEFYADGDAQAEGCGDVTEPVGKLLPVLYGFEDLDKWVFNANNQTVLVMEELLANLYAGPVDVFKTVYYSSTSVTGKLLEWWAIDFATHEGTGCDATFRSDGAGEIESRAVNAAPLLQQYHFAVGLAPHQYHRRVVGFDYTSGARPACANCQGCDNGKEVARG